MIKKQIRIYVLLFLVLLFSLNLYSQIGYDSKIDKYIQIHYFKDKFDENISFEGIFKKYFIFSSYEKNAIYFFNKNTMKISKKYFFKRGTERGDIKNLRLFDYYKDNFWFVDSGNRVSSFVYKNNSFQLKNVFYLVGIESVKNIIVSEDYLYAFGLHYDGKHYLYKYSHYGKKIEKIKKFGNNIPGNIIFSLDGDNLLFGFKYLNSVSLYKKNKKIKKYNLNMDINYKYRNNTIEKNGVLYNIKKIGKYIFYTYWRVNRGGNLNVFDIKKKKVITEFTYPLGQGGLDRNNIFIYRTSFQDNKLKSFIVELELKKLFENLPD